MSNPANKWRVLAQDGGRKVDIRVEGTEFDELVFDLPGGLAFHVERMDNNTWFVGIGDEKVMFTTTKRGVKIGEWYR